MKETLRHKEAFELYYSLGDKRSYRKVADQFSVSETSVKKWAKAHNWQERVLQRDIDLGKKLEEKTNSAVLDMKANYRKVIALAMRSAITNIKDGKLTCDSVADMERLIKLDLLLMGEIEQEKQGDTNVHVSIDVEEARREILSRIDRLSPNRTGEMDRDRQEDQNG